METPGALDLVMRRAVGLPCVSRSRHLLGLIQAHRAGVGRWWDSDDVHGAQRRTKTGRSFFFFRRGKQPKVRRPTAVARGPKLTFGPEAEDGVCVDRVLPQDQPDDRTPMKMAVGVSCVRANQTSRGARDDCRRATRRFDERGRTRDHAVVGSAGPDAAPV